MLLVIRQLVTAVTKGKEDSQESSQPFAMPAQSPEKHDCQKQHVSGASTKLGERDLEQHDHEEEQDGQGAHVDEQVDNGEQLTDEGQK